MKTNGTFFLRAKPWSVRFQLPDGTAAPGWIFPLGERTSTRGVNGFSALWRGPDADRFIAEHRLQAGACLTLELDRLHAAGDELRGHITRCEFAPPRWSDKHGI